MNNIIAKTFGGLNAQYYFRHFIFGLLVAGFFVYTKTQGEQSLAFVDIAFITISTLLYPYSRFVYESIMDFFIGDNAFFLNALVMLFTKLLTIILCWVFAIFIAPIGMAYLYFYHTKEEKKS